jgi:AbrB family looped-hinge helix DNA binding protein
LISAEIKSLPGNTSFTPGTGHFIMLSTLTSKGQVTIPIAMRQQLGLVAGSAVVFNLNGDGSGIVMQAAPSAKKQSKEGYGLVRVKGKHSPADFDAASLLTPS